MYNYYQKLADKQGRDVEEVLADAYRDWVLVRQKHRGTIFGRLWQKVKDLCTKVKALFDEGAKVQSIFQDVESGVVYERDTEDTLKGKGKALVTNGAITGKTLVPVIDVTGLPMVDVNNNQVKKAIAQALRGQTFRIIGSNAIGRVASMADGKHIVAGSNHPNRTAEERKKALSKASEILNNSIYVEKHPDAQHGSGKPYIELYAAVRHNNDIIRLNVIAKEGDLNADMFDIKDVKFYDIKQEGTVATYTPHSGVHLAGTVPSAISVADLLEGVKDRNGKPYVNQYGGLEYEPGAAKYSVAAAPAIGDIFNNAEESTLKGNIAKEGGVKGWLKTKWKEFYVDWFDKNDPLHALDLLIESGLGRKLDESEKVYNRNQTLPANTAGAAETLIEGSDAQIRALNDALGLQGNDRLSLVSMKKVLQTINKQTMDKAAPTFLEDNHFKNWVDAFGGYLGAERLLEMYDLASSEGVDYKLPKGVTEKQLRDFVKSAPKRYGSRVHRSKFSSAPSNVHFYFTVYIGKYICRKW